MSVTDRERPILFSAPMVRAILRDVEPKSQTRRIVDESRLRVRLHKRVSSDLPAFMGPPLIAKPGTYRAKLNQHGAVAIMVGNEWLGVKPGEFHFVCPYAGGDTHLGEYGRGDKRWTITPRASQLWVRETWGFTHAVRHDWKHTYSDHNRAHLRLRATDENADVQRWRPSIFMPRWASRITLVVTGVRLERLQEISELDALAEGVAVPDTDSTITYQSAYARLWDEINGKRAPWSSNPWVWVVSFAVTPPTAAGGR